MGNHKMVFKETLLITQSLWSFSDASKLNSIFKYLILSNLILRLKIPNRFKLNRTQTKNKKHTTY
ncbi:hypothetical protein J2799_004457 [Chryseobacterium vietnamense]|nr:hypothetical protein [Chryseobacterium vietnamense]